MVASAIFITVHFAKCEIYVPRHVELAKCMQLLFVQMIQVGVVDGKLEVARVLVERHHLLHRIRIAEAEQHSMDHPLVSCRIVY